jgi:hypothetical protein
MASAMNRRSFSREEILAKTCTETLSDGPNDALSESEDDCNVDIV